MLIVADHEADACDGAIEADGEWIVGRTYHVIGTEGHHLVCQGNDVAVTLDGKPDGALPLSANGEVVYTLIAIRRGVGGEAFTALLAADVSH